MPSTTSSVVSSPLASSTVITPSLPTFSIASAIMEQQGRVRLQRGERRIRGPDEGGHYRPDQGGAQRAAERGLGRGPALDHGVHGGREAGREGRGWWCARDASRRWHDVIFR